MLKFLFSVALAFVAISANAQEAAAILKAFLKNNEYVTVTSDRGASFNILLGVVDEFRKDGYTPRDEQKALPQSTKRDTWCSVDIRTPAPVKLECYTPLALETALTVQEQVSIESANSRAAIQSLPTRVAQLREKHRRASAYLKANSRSDGTAQYPLNEAPPVPDKK